MELFFKNFDFNKRHDNKIEDNNEKYAVDPARLFSTKINFTGHDLPRDHSPAWEFNFLSILPGIP